MLIATRRIYRARLAPNERMQLTWLTGSPSRPASVHRRASGLLGLGSPATQLMRAVRLLGEIMEL